MTHERLAQPAEETYPGEPENFVLRAIKRWRDRLRDNTRKERWKAYGRITEVVEDIFEISNKDTEIRDGKEVLTLNANYKIYRTANIPEEAYEVGIIETSSEQSGHKHKYKKTKYTTNGRLGKKEVTEQTSEPHLPGRKSKELPPSKSYAPEEWKAPDVNRLAEALETYKAHHEAEEAGQIEG